MQRWNVQRSNVHPNSLVLYSYHTLPNTYLCACQVVILMSMGNSNKRGTCAARGALGYGLGAHHKRRDQEPEPFRDVAASCKPKSRVGRKLNLCRQRKHSTIEA